MIGETGPPQRRKHVIGEDKIARIGEVVRDVGLPHLGVREHGTGQVPVRYQIKPVHLAAVHRLDGVLPSMTKVKRKFIRSASERYYLPLGRPTSHGAVGAGKSAEVGIERTILLDDEDDMLNLREPLGIGNGFSILVLRLAPWPAASAREQQGDCGNDHCQQCKHCSYRNTNVGWYESGTPKPRQLSHGSLRAARRITALSALDATSRWSAPSDEDHVRDERRLAADQPAVWLGKKGKWRCTARRNSRASCSTYFRFGDYDTPASPIARQALEYRLQLRRRRV